jgi:hypothetical protein
MRALMIAFSALSFLGMLPLVIGCGGGTTGRNPRIDPPVENRDVTFEIGPYDTSARGFQFIQSAFAAVSDIKMCIKRLRFREAGSVETDHDFYLGEVTLSPSGTTLGPVTIPDGTYERIEFKLENECGTGRSLRVSNDHGTFSSALDIRIRFEGTFQAVSGNIVTLGIQAIVDELNDVDDVNELQSAAEAADGEIDD